MEKKTTRRGFFGLFGKGAVAGAALAGSGLSLGLDKAVGEDKTCFNFVCSCGEGLAGEVPKEVGQSLRLECAGCKMVWEFTWAGDHFKTRNWPMHKAEAGWNPPAHFNEIELPEEQLSRVDWAVDADNNSRELMAEMENIRNAKLKSDVGIQARGPAFGE